MVYIIMCGGDYDQWEIPKQLTEINGEPIVARTIRLLREAGVESIWISSNNPVFEQFGVPVVHHENGYAYRGGELHGFWVDAFFPMTKPACYIFGDVVFSPEAIRKIVDTETNDIEFFASAPPFGPGYHKPWAEPFALKVSDNDHLRRSVQFTKRLFHVGAFARRPIMWELWQVIKQTPLNIIDYTNYTVINDYTCDIDNPDEADLYRGLT